MHTTIPSGKFSLTVIGNRQVDVSVGASINDFRKAFLQIDRNLNVTDECLNIGCFIVFLHPLL